MAFFLVKTYKKRQYHAKTKFQKNGDILWPEEF